MNEYQSMRQAQIQGSLAMGTHGLSFHPVNQRVLITAVH